MFISFFRSIKYALQDFWRNIWLSLITISVIGLALFTVNIFLVLSVLGNASVSSVEKKIDVSVFFYPDAEESKIFALKSKILAIQNVNEVEFVDSEEALKRFRDTHKDNPTIIQSLDELDTNPLGSSFVIKAQTSSDYDAVLDVVNQDEYDEIILYKNFDDNKEFISRIALISDKVQRVGLALSIVLAVIALIVVFNTIRISIYTRQREIEIMKLVGASSSFILLPYLIQGFIYSLLATGVVIVVLYPALAFVQPYVDTLLLDETVMLRQYFTDNFIFYFGLEFLAVWVLNTISTVLATLRSR